MSNETVKFAKVAVFTDAAKLEENIELVGKKGKTLDNLIHRCAVSCLYHAREHGDVRKITALQEAMPRSARGKGLAHWFVEHMPVQLDDDGKPKVNDNGHYMLKKDRTPEDFTIEEAASMPFWDLTQEKDPAPVGLDVLLKYLNNIAKGGTAKKPVTEAAKLAALAAIEGMKAAANDDANADVAEVVELRTALNK